MSFGSLDNIILSIKSELKELLKSKDKSILQIKKNLYIKNINQSDPEVTFIEFGDIVDRFLNNNKKYYNNNFKNGTKCFRDLDNKLKIDEINRVIKIPQEYQEIYSHFMKLFHIPQPDQRSQEWYDYRYCRVTASDCASALDLNPYEPLESFILKKCDPNFPFRDNKFVVHGKKYEQIATLMYEHIYNVKVTEFGCLPSEKYKFLGASPDGICSAHTLDGKFSKKLGTMLEIKCPYSRPIKHHGLINGEICPNYYFWQIQQQLQCCNLYNCDFWQCNIKEYNSREEYLLDTDFDPIITEDIDNKPVKIDLNIKKQIGKGCLLEFYPRNFIKRWTREEVISELKPWMLKYNCEDDRPYYQAQYIYPPRLDMTVEEYDKWIVSKISTWESEFPHMAKTHYFNKVIYWNIPNSHNVLIKRDDKLFESYLPVLEESFKLIMECRKNPSKLKEIQKVCDRRKKFMYFIFNKKINNKYNISNNDLIKSKKPFLNDYQEVEYSEPTGKNSSHDPQFI
tara:strand:- start:3964 stop:5493 length:1530 start_codon:yes stop_codon:yes gene_type:complete